MTTQKDWSAERKKAYVSRTYWSNGEEKTERKEYKSVKEAISSAKLLLESLIEDRGLYRDKVEVFDYKSCIKSYNDMLTEYFYDMRDKRLVTYEEFMKEQRKIK